MAGVFREITIGWGGKTYTLVPSNKMLRRVDMQLAPRTLVGVFSSVRAGEFPLFDLALIGSEFLKEAGASFTEDDVYAGFVEDMNDNDGAGVMAFAEAINLAITPVGIGEKKAQAPMKAKSSARKPKA